MVKTSQVLRALERAGFQEVDRAGSHVKLRRGSQIAIVPDHGGRDMPPGTLRSILKQAGISADEFRSLL
ncbi:MAG: type II toxin-antitoxin system HicA family toxin [Thermomicrobiales bacterium]